MGKNNNMGTGSDDGASLSTISFGGESSIRAKGKKYVPAHPDILRFGGQGGDVDFSDLERTLKAYLSIHQIPEESYKIFGPKRSSRFSLQLREPPPGQSHWEVADKQVISSAKDLANHINSLQYSRESKSWLPIGVIRSSDNKQMDWSFPKDEASNMVCRRSLLAVALDHIKLVGRMGANNTKTLDAAITKDKFNGRLHIQDTLVCQISINQNMGIRKVFGPAEGLLKIGIDTKKLEEAIDDAYESWG